MALVFDRWQILPTSSGVPRGSILGPMLFIINFNDNDLTVNINHSSSYMFADDTKLIKHIYTDKDLVSLQEDINHLVAWCSKWKLSLNPSKCIAVRFGHCPQLAPPAYQIENGTIQPVSKQQHLCIIVTSKLSWSDHCDTICSKAYRSLHRIRRTVSSSHNTCYNKTLSVRFTSQI